MLCKSLLLILTIFPLLKGQDVSINEAQAAIPLEQSNKKLTIFVQSSNKQEKLQNEVDEIKETLQILKLKITELSNSQKDILKLLTSLSGMNRQTPKVEESVKLNSEAPKMNAKSEALLDEHFNCLKNCGNAWDLPQDCSEAFRDSNQESGVYILKQGPRSLKPFGAFCQRHGGKFWTIIQRRQDGAVNFTRNWNDYKNGFGDLNGDYWLGLERIHAMTSLGSYKLCIQMETFDGKRSYACYKWATVASESDSFQFYSGVFTAGSAKNELNRNDYMKFSTFDVDNDSTPNENCARTHMSGWWFKSCAAINLNGQFKNERATDAIYWDLNNIQPLKYVHMALHPMSL